MNSKSKQDPAISLSGNAGAPDPSSLTTQLVWREIQGLKELFGTRLTSVEEAIELAHEDLVRVPTDVDKAVGALKTLIETRLAYDKEILKLQIDHIKDRFEWIEANRIEQKKDTATAVDAALKAVKDSTQDQNASNALANNKSENSINRQLNSLDDKITDVKERVLGSEGNKQGVTENKAGNTIVVTLIISILLSLAGLAISLFK